MKPYMQDCYSKALKIFLIISTLFSGLYYEPLSCIAVLFLIISLCHCIKHTHKLNVPCNATFFATVTIIIFYGISILWAVDKGMAVFGWAKFLPLPLFLLTITQVSKNKRTELLQLIPWIGIGTTLLTILLSFSKKTAPYVLVNERLSGTFQYPNTFALFLLIGIVLLAAEPHKGNYWIAGIAVLLTGIAFSGSRTVFVLLVLSILLLCILSKEKQVRFVLIGLGLLLILSTVIYTAVTSDISSVSRYLTISVQSSTLQGRLLYWQDALPVILRHPFGLGYMGYHSLLGSFQTGVYSLTHVHNEVLQLLLDIGWISGLFFLYMIIRGIFSKATDFQSKICISIIFLHSLMDFDLQFPIIWFILLLCLTEDTAIKTIQLRKGTLPVFAVVGCISVYFGVVSGAYYTGNVALSAKLHPKYTQANAVLLQRAETPEEMNVYADRMLAVNQLSSLAWSAKARAAYANGNFEQMIQYKEKAIALARYAKEEYLDYFEMLWIGYQLYAQNGDTASGEVCRQKLLAIPEMMEAVLNSTSERAWKIKDIPELFLPNEYLSVLQSLHE